MKQTKKDLISGMKIYKISHITNSIILLTHSISSSFDLAQHINIDINLNLYYFYFYYF
jgi:hypothetical protein